MIILITLQLFLRPVQDIAHPAAAENAHEILQQFKRRDAVGPPLPAKDNAGIDDREQITGTDILVLQRVIPQEVHGRSIIVLRIQRHHRNSLHHTSPRAPL
jgi:hypothetical protein